MRILMTAVWVLAVSAAACTSGPNPTKIEGADTRALMPSIRAIWDNSEEIQKRLKGPPGNVYSTFQATFDRSAGRFDQVLDPGEPPIDFGGTSVTPPADVGFDFELLSVRGAADLGVIMSDEWRLGVLLGAGIDILRLELDTGMVHDTETIWSPGVIIGLSTAWDPFPFAGTYFQASFGNALAAGDEIKTTRIELGLSLSPIPSNPSFRFIGGLRRIHYVQDRNSSDLDLEMEGIFFGLEFRN